MKLGTANIRNFPDMTHRQVAQDVGVVASSCTLAGLQEIQPGEDTLTVERTIGDGWWMVGRRLEVPVIGRKDRWKTLHHHVQSFDRPAGLPRPQNPHGGIVSVVVRSTRKPKLPPFAVVNVHLISGGMNGPKLPELAARWRVEWGMFMAECVRLWRNGLTVYPLGDLNNPHPPAPVPHSTTQLEWLNPDGAPDHIGQLVNHASVMLDGCVSESIPLHSDHNLHVVSGPLTKA